MFLLRAKSLILPIPYAKNSHLHHGDSKQAHKYHKNKVRSYKLCVHNTYDDASHKSQSIKGQHTHLTY